MGVVGKHFTFLLIVVEWLKSKHFTAKTHDFLLPFQRQARPGRLAAWPLLADVQLAEAKARLPADRGPQVDERHGVTVVGAAPWAGGHGVCGRFGWPGIGALRPMGREVVSRCSGLWPMAPTNCACDICSEALLISQRFL